MKWFVERTKGKPCIMGRKTWESLPKRPLPGRTNIVVTRDDATRPRGRSWSSSVDAAIRYARPARPDGIVIIGGAEIYRAALVVADRIYLTSVHGGEVAGDTYFPIWTGRLGARRLSKFTLHGRAADRLPFHHLDKVKESAGVRS